MQQYHGGPPQQPMYRPDWPPQYAQHQHGMPGPYSSPATSVSTASPAATAGPRPGQVCSPLSSVKLAVNCAHNYGKGTLF